MFKTPGFTLTAMLRVGLVCGEAPLPDRMLVDENNVLHRLPIRKGQAV
jgi:hypothetical protein